MGLAAGAALALALARESNDIAVAAFGEGAAIEGMFWETLNYAALRRLPVLFVCENNKYATFSPQLARQPCDNLSEKVAAFGVRTEDMFGNDVAALYRTLAQAIESIRRGDGPFFLQSYTYRWNGHVGPEDDDFIGYRPEAEIELWKQNCPIAMLDEKLSAAGLLTPALKSRMTARNRPRDRRGDGFRSIQSFPHRPRLGILQRRPLPPGRPTAGRRRRKQQRRI